MAYELAKNLFNTINSLANIRRINYSSEILNSEYHILQLIYYHEGDCIALSDLADKMGVSVPSVSRSIKGLVEKDLVKRSYDPKDRRTTYVMISDLGIEKYLGVSRMLKEYVGDILSSYDEDELEAFIRTGQSLARDLALSGEAYEEKLKSKETKEVK